MFAYHATSPRSVSSIARNGIEPRRQPVSHRGERRSTSVPSVYFAVTPQHAHIWGPVLLRFPWPDDAEADPYSDTIILPDGEVVESQWLSREWVEPEAIDLMTQTGWHRLTEMPDLLLRKSSWMKPKKPKKR